MGRSLLVAVLVALAGAVPAAAATVHRDLGYGPDPLNRLDVYAPAGARPGDARPVVVYVHGGGWAIGDKANRIEDKARLFTGAGYVFASVNYRLSPRTFDPAHPDPARVMFPDQPHDVGEAVGWLGRHVARYGGDGTRMLLVGHSAGAHLVALVSADPAYLRAYGIAPWRVIGTVALDSDAYDIPARLAGATRRARLILFNAFGTPAENAATNGWSPASPITWADPRDPRTLFVTESGNPGRVAEAGRMATALGEDPAGYVLPVPYTHRQINAALGSASDPAGETARVMRFVSRRVKVSRGPHVRLRRHPPHHVRAHRRRVRLRLAFAGDVARSTFRCRVDGGRVRRCRSPQVVRLGRGRHRIRIRAVAPNGRPGPVRSFHLRVVRSR